MVQRRAVFQIFKITYLPYPTLFIWKVQSIGSNSLHRWKSIHRLGQWCLPTALLSSFLHPVVCLPVLTKSATCCLAIGSSRSYVFCWVFPRVSKEQFGFIFSVEGPDLEIRILKPTIVQISKQRIKYFNSIHNKYFLTLNYKKVMHLSLPPFAIRKNPIFSLKVTSLILPPSI